jgi:ElaB/YqjD/DUF883 family membrane-anchored ribosome-binding protein
MAETTNEIRHHIEFQRGRLAENINELENRVRTIEYRAKEAVDWRHQFRTHTGTALGIAFGGGLLLGLLSGRGE